MKNNGEQGRPFKPLVDVLLWIGGATLALCLFGSITNLFFGCGQAPVAVETPERTAKMALTWEDTYCRDWHIVVQAGGVLTVAIKQEHGLTYIGNIGKANRLCPPYHADKLSRMQPGGDPTPIVAPEPVPVAVQAPEPTPRIYKQAGVAGEIYDLTDILYDSGSSTALKKLGDIRFDYDLIKDLGDDPERFMHFEYRDRQNVRRPLSFKSVRSALVLDKPASWFLKGGSFIVGLLISILLDPPSANAGADLPSLAEIQAFEIELDAVQDRLLDGVPGAWEDWWRLNQDYPDLMAAYAARHPQEAAAYQNIARVYEQTAYWRLLNSTIIDGASFSTGHDVLLGESLFSPPLDLFPEEREAVVIMRPMLTPEEAEAVRQRLKAEKAEED